MTSKILMKWKISKYYVKNVIGIKAQNEWKTTNRAKSKGEIQLPKGLKSIGEEPMLSELIITASILLWLYWIYHRYKKQNSIHIDPRGYERDGYNQLIHRKIAYKYLYSYPQYSLRFGSYDIHHRDGNKRNNSPDNLQILTRKQHKAKHK